MNGDFETEEFMSESTAVSVPEQSVVVADEPMELQLIAHSREQMASVQTKLVAWAEKKLNDAKSQMDEASQAKTVALASGFNADPFTRSYQRSYRLYSFYDKIKAAIEAGYVIIPDFPVDVFAIRTTKSRPKPMETKWRGETRAQSSESPSRGEGVYVDSDPTECHSRTEYITDQKTKEVNPQNYWRADEFRDVIDFPLSIAKAEIMDDVACAMQHKIFDEIGVLPERRTQKRDPIVTGIIRDPRSSKYNDRRVMFLLAWYLDTRTL